MGGFDQPGVQADLRQPPDDQGGGHRTGDHPGLDAEEEVVEPSIDQDHRLMIRSEYRRVLAAMASLEENEREILSLAAGGDLSYSEIASLVGISEGNVKVKVHRARLKLRQILKEKGR